MTHQLPPLDDEYRFEMLVRDILRRVYDDPGVERFGKRGQAQHGIDGLSPADPGVTFQCKWKDTRYGDDERVRKKLLEEMEAEVGKTGGLGHAPRRFIFASTHKNDTHLQQKAASLSTASMTVEYWGWDTISEKIWEHAEALLPDYYPQIPVRRVPGLRHVSPDEIARAETKDAGELDELAKDYYRIDDRSEVVFRVVCNDLDVRNERVMAEVYERLRDRPSGGTLWILGDGGSGKTTILHRLSVELARHGANVYTLDLETELSKEDLESVLSRLKFSGPPGMTVLCVDNPAHDEETLEALLRRVPDYCPEIRVLLAERGHRYHTLRNAGCLTYLHGEEEENTVFVRNTGRQRQSVYDRLFELLCLSEADAESVRDIALDERLVYVNATYSILLELKRKRRIHFDFDWDDYRKSTADLPAFGGGYKYIALFYLFGVRTPFAVLSKISGADEGQQRAFVERFRGLVNEPVIVDERRDEEFRKSVHVRTKHEIVSEIFFREHPNLNKNELLMEWCEQTDFTDTVETQALINILGAKKNYAGDNPHVDLRSLTDFLLRGHLREKVAASRKLNATLHLAKFWSLQFQGNLDEAIKSLESFLAEFPGDIHSRTELAKLYQKQNRLSDAEAILHDILVIRPDDLNSRIELAKIYQRQGKQTDAAAILLKLLELDDRNIRAYTELAKVYQKQNRLSEAEAALAKVLIIRPTDLNSRTELAKIYQRQGKLAEAEAVLLRLLGLEPDSLQARTELSKIYQRQGKLTEAESLLLKSLEIDPQQLHPRTELAKIYQRQRRYDEAIRRLKEYIELDPQGLHPRTELAKIYQRQNRLTEAETVLLRLLELEPDDLQARTELAKIYQRQGKLTEAEAVLLELLKLDADNLRARTELSKIYQRQSRLAEAEAVLLKSLEIDPQQLHPRTELAKIYQRQNRLAEAEGVLLKSLEIDSQQLHPRTELAKIYQRQNKLAEAESLLLKSLEIDPQQLHPRTELAKIYQRQNKLAEAEAVLLRLLELEPDDLQARTELSKIYQRQGKLTEAEAILLESLEIDPQHLHARIELAKIYQRQGRYDEAEKRAEEALRIDPLNDHAMCELLGVWKRRGEGEKCVRTFMAFIGQWDYRFSRYSQAPVYRFFQCCKAFGMKEQAEEVFRRFEAMLDERNREFYFSNFDAS